MKNTPNYIKSLLLPTTKATQERKAWSIPLETVIVPFFTATNTMGDSTIPHDALGAPLRLARDKDGSVRFGNNGKPVIRIAKPLSQAVTIMRENFVANLKNYAETVKAEKSDEYAMQVEMAQEAAKPIQEQEQTDLDKAVKLRLADTVNKAEIEPDTEPEKERELQPA